MTGSMKRKDRRLAAGGPVSGPRDVSYLEWSSDAESPLESLFAERLASSRVPAMDTLPPVDNAGTPPTRPTLVSMHGGRRFGKTAAFLAAAPESDLIADALTSLEQAQANLARATDVLAHLPVSGPYTWDRADSALSHLKTVTDTLASAKVWIRSIETQE